MVHTTRRMFLGSAALVGAGCLLPRTVRGADKGPRLDLDVVGEVVRVAHFDLDALARHLAAQPALANACHDWGGGDFETPLGAASHMGEREIARHLLAQGARPDIFAAVMLGETEIVRAMLDWRADLIQVKGPHGLSLMHHARKGGSEPMQEFLASRGAA